MKTYSQDLRERMLGAVDRGMPRKNDAVRAFGVSLATLKHWLKRRREEGSATPKRRPGMRPRIGANAEERRALWESSWRRTPRRRWRSTASSGSGGAACGCRSPP